MAVHQISSGGAMDSLRWSLVMVTVAWVMLQAVVPGVDATGTWTVVSMNAGVAAMHAVVTPNVGSLVILDHTNTGPSNLTFPDGRCRNTTYDLVLKHDCFAHSAVLNLANGSVRPLMVWTDTWCSSGQLVSDGSLQQTGGDYEGMTLTRSLSPNCYTVDPISQHCDWQQNNVTNTSTTPLKLRFQRWYSTNVLLPDGRQIIFGGRNGQNTNEYAPPLPKNQPTRFMSFLSLTTDSSSCNTTTNAYCNVTRNGPNNWYPFAILQPNDTIYLFANRDSIMYDYKNNVVVRTYPKIPGNPRNYPSSGSAVMLPLKWDNDYQTVEVLVCGGATDSSNVNAPASKSCGRMTVSDPAANWTMEDMPINRVMGELIILPDTNILVINGARAGYSGWRTATLPALNPVLYEPAKPLGSRFTTLDPTTTPRMYHSTANLATDASVIVAGSNSNQYYTFKKPNGVNAATFFPTELSVDSFLPPYAQGVAGGRPTIQSVDQTVVKLGNVLQVLFYDSNTDGNGTLDTFLFTMNSAPWSTHAFSQGQRMVTLNVNGTITMQGGSDMNAQPVWFRQAGLAMPKYAAVLPPAYYMLWVVKNGNPSNQCIWVRITM